MHSHGKDSMLNNTQRTKALQEAKVTCGLLDNTAAILASISSQI